MEDMTRRTSKSNSGLEGTVVEAGVSYGVVSLVRTPGQGRGHALESLGMPLSHS